MHILLVWKYDLIMDDNGINWNVSTKEIQGLKQLLSFTSYIGHIGPVVLVWENVWSAQIDIPVILKS